jgi:hypothetical protein
MQRDHPFQVFREFNAIRWQALRERIATDIERVAHVVDAGQQRAEELAVVREAADRDAAEADTVIALFATDQARALAVAAGTVIGQRDLQCGIDRLRARIGEEHAVHAFRRDRGQAFGHLERQGMTHLEGRREVHRRDLLLHGSDDAVAAMAGIAAPQAAGAIEDFATIDRGVEHALRGCEQARLRLELSVGRERHPERPHLFRRRGRFVRVMAVEGGEFAAHVQAP